MSPQENSSFLNRLFTHNPQTIRDEIRATLNADASPTGFASKSSLQENVVSVFQSLGFGAASTTSTTSPSSTWKQPVIPEREFETKPAMHKRYAAPHQRSSYQIHQGNEQIQVDVNASGLSKDDIQVEVLNMSTCMVQWSTTSSKKYSHRLRLGSSVDCQRLSAKLNQHGVLQMTAPLKTDPDVDAPIKQIPITTQD